MMAMIISPRLVVAALSGSLRHLNKPLGMSLLGDFASPSAVRGLLGTARIRAMNTLSTKDEMESTIQRKERLEEYAPVSSYAGNPCIHFTSLAHLQWKYVLRPGVDAAIDATCGNGNDSCELASLLFSDDNPGQSELICIDIQEAACRATRKALEEKIDPNIIENHSAAFYMPLILRSQSLLLLLLLSAGI
jgi:hypothetical protein